MAKLKVAVLMGGRSGEHEVSLVSGGAVMANLDRRKYSATPVTIPKSGRADWAALARYDVVFPVLHGPYGEDGTVQGMLELLGIPYVGAGVLGSAVAMDKDVMKRLFLHAGLPTADYVCLRRGERPSPAALARRLGYPMFAKPANLGSSVGISKVHNRGELAAALALAFQHDDKIVLERGLDARELECAVLGNQAAEASVVGEVVPGREFYDYQAKYSDAGSQTLVPASLPAAVARQVRALALRAFQVLECCGMARVDFFLERGTGRIYLNEINTIPGFTPISMYPMLWAASGVPFPALLARLIALARERGQSRAQIAI